MKQCKKCNAVKPLDQFYKHAQMKDGYLNQCIPCRDAYVAEWQEKNRERRRQIARESRAKHYDPERAKVANAKQYEKLKASDKYVGVVERVNAARLIDERQRPMWANQAAILAMYAKARRLTEETGVVWTVDHIVPLNSAKVCGLHTEANMEVITKAANSSKKNRHWPDMP